MTIRLWVCLNYRLTIPPQCQVSPTSNRVHPDAHTPAYGIVIFQHTSPYTFRRTAVREAGRAVSGVIKIHIIILISKPNLLLFSHFLRVTIAHRQGIAHGIGKRHSLFGGLYSRLVSHPNHLQPGHWIDRGPALGVFYLTSDVQ